MSDLFEACREAVLKGDRSAAETQARRALEAGADPLELIEKGFVPGLQEVGRLWEEGEAFLPELVTSAGAMKAAGAILQPELARRGQTQKARGRVVIGTIEGDIHDIGKTLVATMLSANGYETRDLGVDVPVAKFVEEAMAFKADFICISTLLTTTMTGQKRVIDLLKERSLRDKVRVLVGGSPCSEAWAAEIGADGYAPDALSAVQLADTLCL
ncbi:MAG: corrinoid protein [Planctomycetota bacterium]|jgi:trimethylamine corrinoid protein